MTMDNGQVSLNRPVQRIYFTQQPLLSCPEVMHSEQGSGSKVCVRQILDTGCLKPGLIQHFSDLFTRAKRSEFLKHISAQACVLLTKIAMSSNP